MSEIRWDAPELAERYDRVSDSQFDRGVALTKRMGVRAGDAVLDVGCGTGRLALYLSPVVGPGGRVVGIDPSPHRIAVASGKLRDRAPANVQFAVGSGESPGRLPDGAFDHVCFCSVFHWIDDKPAALGAAYRLLKPGGHVGITTADRDHPSGLRGIRDRLFTRPPYAGVVRMDEEASKPVTARELRALLAGAGFTEIGITLRASKRYYSSPEEAFEFSEASSFGNFLRNVPEELRPRARRDLAEELEKRRTPSGIELERKPLCAIARRPEETT